MSSVRVRHRGPSVRSIVLIVGDADFRTRVRYGDTPTRQVGTIATLGSTGGGLSAGVSRRRLAARLFPRSLCPGELLTSLPEPCLAPHCAVFRLLEVLPIPADRVVVTTLLRGSSYSASENDVNWNLLPDFVLPPNSLSDS